MQHMPEEECPWYRRLQRSWTINAIVIPTAISLICQAIFQWMK
jgi:hypothetical protein